MGCQSEKMPSLLMVGPPGSGKSMLAQRFAGLLPPMTDEEALECAALTSLCGRFDLADFLAERGGFDSDGRRHSVALAWRARGRTPAEGLAFSAMAEGRLVGTLRLWHVSAGGCPALVLGPLAGVVVEPAAEEAAHDPTYRSRFDVVTARAVAALAAAGTSFMYQDAPEFERFVQADAQEMATLVTRIGKVE